MYLRRIISRLKHNIRYDIRQLQYVRHANEINAFLDVPAIENRVNIYDYNPTKLGYKVANNKPYNLGDYLGRVIVKFLLDKKGIDINQYIPEKKHLFTVGSNIFGSEYRGNYQNATIWGSGVMAEPSRRESFFQKLSRRHLDIRAVRGPLSREILLEFGHNCPAVFGDPAILMPLIYHPDVKKKHKRLIVPQFYSEQLFRKDHPNEEIISMNTDDYEYVINEICASEIVYASSLHGIILAESYGVPAIFFRGLSKRVDFKYRDYYSSTGRNDIKLVDTFEEALAMTPPPLPDLDSLRQGLLDSFPYDLWESK